MTNFRGATTADFTINHFKKRIPVAPASHFQKYQETQRKSEMALALLKNNLPLIVAGVAVASVGVVYYYNARQPQREPSLYQKIGGEAAIDATVENFYDRVIVNPVLAPFFKNTNMVRQRAMQKAFLNHVLGNKPWNGQNMRKAHAHLKLTDVHFDEVVKELVNAMRHLKVPENLIKQVGAVTETTRNDILGR
ncbi:hypothetical protein SeMB42_g02231 [Synchytrium endobioticum]|uniref:Globin family profile domain-containing protein n=1 Tax=Synchytrium endobioticum TaxID=286115 RepID=A0A507DHR1_9FUNG|nr:hypothetical protein SeMB42_g02231 [Synchytrium endobioticum]TPX51001.1 hypothetical protein SeLEV6574_g00568 [Synchytrium endobioticum]